MPSMKWLPLLALSLFLSFALPNNAQVTTNLPSSADSRRIQNVAPEEMWKRVTQCALPTYPGLAFDSQITGTVDIGLAISPDGNVGNNSRVLDGPPLLVQSAMDAIREWKFRPNIVQGAATWSRVRALVRFNADGTTAVDFAPAILADNFGDPGTTKSAATASPRPAGSPECKSMQQGAEAAKNVIARAGTGGVTVPTCVYCPDPKYTSAARDAKYQGTVVLNVVVTAEGRAERITVVKGPGLGLEVNAIMAVKEWRFKPATGPDGRPVAVRIPIEVTFRLSRSN